MTIDERLDKLTDRLDRLTERHEALTESVELMAREFREAIARILSLTESNFKQIQILLEITKSHEHRISNLEGKQ